MRWARVPRTGARVDAFDYGAKRPQAGLVCPRCDAPVVFRIRIGRGDDPGFAHASGRADPYCDDFHPGLWGDGGSSQAGTFEVEDDPDELGLVVEQLDRRWSLLLRVPEMPDDELGLASLTTLHAGFVEIFAGDAAVERISALDVRPGVGVARAVVPPSLQPYRTKTGGHWPAGAALERWNASARPLAAVGSLFRLRSGEWVRLQERSLVQLGEQLVVVADTSCPPIPGIVSEHGDVLSGAGQRWGVWRVRLPTTSSSEVEEWLERLGFSLAAPAWTAEIVSVPASLGATGAQFFRGDAVVVELRRPTPASTASLLLTSGTNSYSLSVGEGGSGRLLASFSAARPSSARIDVAAEPPASIDCEFIERPSAVSLGDLLTAVPRLRVWVGDQRLEAWSGPPPLPLRSDGDVRVDVGVTGARVDVVVRADGARRVLAALTVRDAERAIKDAIATASAIEVDAGNLGRVELAFAHRRDRREAVASDRLGGWLWVVGGAAAPTRSQTPVLHVSPGRAPRLRLARTEAATLAQMRVAARRRRTGKATP